MRAREERTLPKVETIILMTEKEVIFCLPDPDWKRDYAPLIGKDVSFHQWCRDLYLHYWEKAKPALSPLAK